jgi:UDPglucose 6-dehydrogenase
VRKIAVIGAGYVGLVTGTCFAELGNNVVCIDVERSKIDALNSGALPFFEPGLLEMVSRNRDAGRLTFTVSIAEGLFDREVVFIAVGTPQGQDGQADLQHVRAAARDIAANLTRDCIVVNKSTVPVETGDMVSAIINENSSRRFSVSVVSNPEFLREGNAIADFMQPDRIVVGIYDSAAADTMHELYAPLNAPMIVTDVRTAEMIKYTANAFLATKISFINEIANICDRVGADVKDVVAGAGSDKRIGTAFMNAGIGFGGSCFPKDVMALSRIAELFGVEPLILDAVLAVNRRQVVKTFQRIREALGELGEKRVAVLGLSFKPNTDDIRESPALALTDLLLRAGAIVVVHDPVAMKLVAQTDIGNQLVFERDSISAARDADALVVATDWNEYKQLDLRKIRAVMKGNLLVDGRNIYEPDAARDANFRHIGVGRGKQSPLATEATANRS